ncbi:hypothetical protein N9Y42_06725 [Mariniblastus sp.]|nr:hypothetical protein [Mariniblastus sp.]
MKIRILSYCVVLVLYSFFTCLFALPTRAQEVFRWSGEGMNWSENESWVGGIAPPLFNSGVDIGLLFSYQQQYSPSSYPLGLNVLSRPRVTSAVFELDAPPDSNASWNLDFPQFPDLQSGFRTPLIFVDSSISLIGKPTTRPQDSRVYINLTVFCPQYNIDYGEVVFSHSVTSDGNFLAAGLPADTSTANQPLRYSTTTPGNARVTFDAIGVHGRPLSRPLFGFHSIDPGILLTLSQQVWATGFSGDELTAITVNGETRFVGSNSDLPAGDPAASGLRGGGSWVFNGEVAVIGTHTVVDIPDGAMQLNSTLTIEDGSLTIERIGNDDPLFDDPLIGGEGKIVVKSGGILRNRSNSHILVPVELEPGGVFEGSDIFVERDPEPPEPPSNCFPPNCFVFAFAIGDDPNTFEVDLTTTETTCVVITGPPTSGNSLVGYEGDGTNDLTVRGTLMVDFNGYIPSSTEQYDLVSNFQSVNGTFESVVFENYSYDIEYGSTFVRLSNFNLRTLLGDVDQSGQVDFSDISPFIVILSSNGFSEEADVNQDNSVDFSDIGPFIVALAGQ